MARRTYAATSDYDDIYGAGSAAGSGITDNALAEATITIDEVLIGAVYDVADIGADTNMPTAPVVQDILRRAVCAQAYWSDEIGDTNGTGTVRAVQSASIGSVSWSGGSEAGLPGSAMTTISGRPVAASAYAVLRIAGLLPVSAHVHG